MSAYEHRGNLLRRAADVLRSKRLDAAGRNLLREIDQETQDRRKEVKISPEQAVKLINQHGGSAEAAAKAVGNVSGQTLRRMAKRLEQGN